MAIERDWLLDNVWILLFQIIALQFNQPSKMLICIYYNKSPSFCCSL